MTIALLTDSNLSTEQEEVLCDLWRDSTGLWGSAWHPSGGYRFPETVGALEDICDNNTGIKQTQIMAFISDLRHGSRCRVCGTGSEVAETGVCGDCAIDLDVD